MEQILSIPEFPSGLPAPNPPRRIVAFLCYQGNRDAQAFMEGLPLPSQKSYLSTFYQHAIGQIPAHHDWHTLSRKLKTMKEDLKGLSEFVDIASKTRLIGFDHHCNGQSMIIITHGFQKKEDELRPSEVREAKRRREWFFENHKCPTQKPKSGEKNHADKKRKR